MIAFLLLVGTLLVLIGIGVPIAFAMSAGVIFAILFIGPADLGLTVLGSRLLDAADAWAWIAIPLFLLLGMIMNAAGITSRLVRLSQTLVGHIPGSLSHVSVLTNVLMAGMSGSLLADAAAIGSMLSPSMKEQGYPLGYIAAIITTGAIIGPLIPPSINFIIVGSMANISILRLWLGGAIPGFILGGGLIAIGYLVCRGKGYAVSKRAPLRGILYSTLSAGPALVIPFLIIGGMRAGLVTPTEAAAGGVIYVLLIAFTIYGRRDWKSLWRESLGSINTIGGILFLIACASFFAWGIAFFGVGNAVTDILLSITGKNPLAFLLLMELILIALGCVMDTMPILLIFLPLFMPTVHALGIDTVHFGCVFGYTSLVASLTPPVGTGMYMMCSVTGCSVGEYTREGWPFLVIVFGLCFLMVFFPQIVVWLPNIVLGPASKI